MTDFVKEVVQQTLDIAGKTPPDVQRVDTPPLRSPRFVVVNHRVVMYQGECVARTRSKFWARTVCRLLNENAEEVLRHDQ